CFKEIFQPLTALPMRQSAARWAVLGSDVVDQVEAANKDRQSLTGARRMMWAKSNLGPEDHRGTCIPDLGPRLSYGPQIQTRFLIWPQLSQYQISAFYDIGNMSIISCSRTHAQPPVKRIRFKL